MQRAVVAGAVGFVLLTGCGSVSDGFVAREWSKNMRELGVYPIFPPREDFQVGDVFVHVVGPGEALESDAQGNPPIGLLFERLDTRTLMTDYYARTPEFPASSASSPGATTKSIFVAPTVQTRLKSVAFPYFLKATATGAEIGALIPIEALQRQAGLSLSSVKSASVTVSAAESLSLPWAAISSLVVDANDKVAIGFSGAGTTRRTAEETRRLLTQVAKRSKLEGTFVDVTVATEVFYARTFDVTLHMREDAALALSRTTPTAADAAASAAAAAAAAASSSEATGSPAVAASAAQAARSAAQLAEKQSEKLLENLQRARALGQLTPGVTVGFSSSATGDVGLRSSYERPIAVGYRGIRYRVSLLDGSAEPLPPSSTKPLTKDGLAVDSLKAGKAAAPASAASK